MAVDKVTEQYLNLYNSMSPQERFAAGVTAPDFIIGLSKEQIELALKRLQNFNAKIKCSLKERNDELAEKAKKSEQRWLMARKKYYTSLAAIPINKYDENYAKLKKISEDNFFDLTLAGEAYVHDTKRANDSSISISYMG